MLDALTMSDGRSIPAQGFGVFQIPAEQTADAVAQAIEVGYRHIDTAQSYFNEEAVGEGYPSQRDRPQRTVRHHEGLVG